MNNLAHYRKGAVVIICPAGKESPLIEATITGKAQGRGSNPSLIKVQATRPLDIFGEKHKSFEGTSVNPSDTAWLNPKEWEVRARANKQGDSK
jgi:hypothetical protein